MVRCHNGWATAEKEKLRVDDKKDEIMKIKKALSGATGWESPVDVAQSRSQTAQRGDERDRGQYRFRHRRNPFVNKSWLFLIRESAVQREPRPSF